MLSRPRNSSPSQLQRAAESQKATCPKSVPSLLSSHLYLPASFAIYEYWLLTSTWNMVNAFTTEFLTLNTVGMAPRLLSAISPAAHRSASEKASSFPSPFLRFCSTLARTSASETMRSTNSMATAPPSWTFETKSFIFSDWNML